MEKLKSFKIIRQPFCEKKSLILVSPQKVDVFINLTYFNRFKINLNSIAYFDDFGQKVKFKFSSRS